MLNQRLYVKSTFICEINIYMWNQDLYVKSTFMIVTNLLNLMQENQQNLWFLLIFINFT